MSCPAEQDLLQLRRPRAFAQSIPGGDHRELVTHPGVGAVYGGCVALHRQGGEQHPTPSGPVLRCSAPSACPHRERDQRLRAAAVGLPFADADRLLISDCEHPGVVSACMELAQRQNLTIDVLPVKHLRGDQTQCDAAVLESITQTLTPRTRLVVLSHLLWNTGQVMPIAAVADQLNQHPQKPFLLVDAAQSFGQIPVEAAAAAADIYAFTGHKWACGPEGLGGVALSERVVTEAAPTMIGWRSLRNESKTDLNNTDLFHHDSRRFEIATSCVPLMAGLRTSLQLLENAGSAQQRWDRIRTLSSSLWEALQRLEHVTPLLEVPPASGLVSFQVNGDVDPAEHVKQLGARGLWIRDLADPNCLRACTHISTTDDDINGLVAEISIL